MANIDVEQLVNKNYPLSKDYVPDDLIVCDNNDADQEIIWMINN